MDLSLTPTAYIDPAGSQFETLVGGLHPVNGRETAAKIREAGQEFEGFFISYLLKTMRETVHAGLLKNQAGQMFQSFYDQELGRVAAQAGGLGLGKIVETYIRQQNATIDTKGLKFSSRSADNSSGEGGTLGSPQQSRIEFNEGRN
jgi:flagellar protein FlgJ